MQEPIIRKQIAVELFMLSLIVLYLELLVVRWMSNDISAFSVFKTFPLVTCFVGLGFGFAQTSDRLFRFSAIAILFFVALMKLSDLCGYSYWFFPSVSIFAWQHLELLQGNFWTYVFVSIAILLLLLIGPFTVMAALGARLGVLLDQFKPLEGYCINIGGSIAGSLIFALASFWAFPPGLLLVPMTIVLAFYMQRENRNFFRNVLPLFIAVGVALIGDIPVNGYGTYWSPYQRLDILPLMVKAGTKATAENLGIVIGANRNFYQYALDLSDKTIGRSDWPAVTQKLLKENAMNYNLPYKLKSANNVLILGAGSGNDVAAALRHNVKHVDAIDIDPLIIKFGKKYHPEHPYDSQKVTLVCDDARNFLQHCKKSYDLIVFAGLDSHTVTGQGASMRIDNYVYTIESLRRALKLLKSDGLLVLSFCKSKPWLTARLFSTINYAAGYPPLVLIDQNKPQLQWEIFLTGPLVQKHLVQISKELMPFGVELLPSNEYKSNRILTDDWPFVYVAPVAVDLPYLLVVISVLLLSIYMVRHSLFKVRDLQLWQMFFLGAAFLLLELQSIARLSLLYGSTWLTSAIVVNGVLIMILIANLFVIRFDVKRITKVRLLYLALGIALLISYFLPIGTILGIERIAIFNKYLITTITLLPILFASIIFAIAFSKTNDAAKALAFNLFGAVIGAMVEYLSNYLGINALVLIALTFYLGAFFCSKDSLCLQKTELNSSL